MKKNLNIPNHVAIILDGNGRWAKKRNLKRSLGHKAGFENLKTLSKYIFKSGVKVLSVFAFSTENFKREKSEVDYLMDLLVNRFKELLKDSNDVKIVFSGKRDNLRKDVVDAIEKIENETMNNEGHLFNICFNYGGRLDIIEATKKIAIDYSKNHLDIESLNEENYFKYLYNEIPDIDLLIRTSGEIRISNFILYQAAYAEFYFTDVLFPDFDKEKNIIKEIENLVDKFIEK